MSKGFKPRRSVLFVPGSSEKMLEKARNLPCDVVVLDLEDSVAPQAKQAARTAVCAAVKDYGSREVVVRINPPASPDGRADLEAVRAASPDAVLLPKVESAADIAAAKGGVPIWAMIETPLGVLNVAAIAASGVACLAMGTNDLLKAMQAQPLPDRRNLWTALSQTVIAGRAHGVSVIDGTYNDIRDDAGFAESCAQGRAFGFDGKTLIHPGQIEACNRAFAPSAEEIAQARRILDAFAQNPGKGAIAIDGQMVERLHADQARHLLALAAAIESRA
ncbi:MAG TPA: CoA ester lyase [Rhizomicrobium sp.]|nr:CoA ester lyase [Rhizomicrobium sp.]